MKKVKSFLKRGAEYYFMVLGCGMAYSPIISHINPIALGFVAILILQLIFKNKLTGILIADLFLVIDLFFLGAMLSEFREFPVFNTQAFLLLSVGLSIFIANLIMGVMMILKYYEDDENIKIQTDTNI